MLFHWIVSLILVAGLIFPPSIAAALQTPVPQPLSAPAIFFNRLVTVVGSAAVDGNAAGMISANCPAGMVAISGGVDTENVRSINVTSSGPTYGTNHSRLLLQADGSGPAPTGWQARVFNNTSGAYISKVAVLCAPVVGVTSVVASANLTHNSSAVVQAACPANSVALSGGIDSNVSDVDASYVKVTSSGPTYGQNNDRLMNQTDGGRPAPSGWRASAINSDVVAHPIKVAAVCAPASGVTSVVGSQTIQPGTFNYKQAACPAGSGAVGGGVDVEDPVNMLVNSSSPVFAQNFGRLNTQPDGNNPAPSGWWSAAYNPMSSPLPLKTAIICAQLPTQTFIPVISR